MALQSTLALPFVLHMLRVYYATTYVSIERNARPTRRQRSGDGCVENECSADNCGLIARVSVENDRANQRERERGMAMPPPAPLPLRRTVLHLCKSRWVRARGCFLSRVVVALCVISRSWEGTVKQVFGGHSYGRMHV